MVILWQKMDKQEKRLAIAAYSSFTGGTIAAVFLLISSTSISKSKFEFSIS